MSVSYFVEYMKILVVAREKPDVVHTVSNGLIECGYAVDVVETRRRGIRLLKISTYDLILCVSNLRSGNGEFCRRVRGLGDQSALLVLLQECEPNQIARLLDAGADDCMQRTVGTQEFLARVRALLRRSQVAADDVLHVGDLTLDVTKYQVLMGCEELHLNRKEFSLLEYLMRHQGRVQTRSVLREHVWDTNADPLSYTIEAHINRLRRKLGDENHQLIRTVTGQGYVIGV